MQRALVIHSAGAIESQDLLFEAALTARAPLPAVGAGAATLVAGVEDDAGELDSLGEGLREHERRLILDALEEGRGSRKYAAEKLGISPRTLRYKLARLREQGIAVPGH
jgi:two-component system response regulator FlrC